MFKECACRILCFVDRASLYNLVNKANLVQKEIVHQVGFIYKNVLVIVILLFIVEYCAVV